MSTDAKVLLAATLFVGALVLGVVGYDIYLHPADPEPVGTATIEISGSLGVGFSGVVGTFENEQTIEAQTPVTVEVGYRRSDYVAATIRRDDHETDPEKTLSVKITAEGRVVDERIVKRAGAEVLVMWKAPLHG